MGMIQRRNLFAYPMSVAVAALLLLGPGAPPAESAVAKLEQKCASKLGKSSAKLSSTASKSLAKCRNADISGKAVAACPDSKATYKINKASSKLLLSAVPDRNGRRHRELKKAAAAPKLERTGDGCPFVGRCSEAADVCRSTAPPVFELGPQRFTRCHGMVSS